MTVIALFQFIDKRFQYFQYFQNDNDVAALALISVIKEEEKVE